MLYTHPCCAGLPPGLSGQGPDFLVLGLLAEVLGACMSCKETTRVHTCTGCSEALYVLGGVPAVRGLYVEECLPLRCCENKRPLRRHSRLTPWILHWSSVWLERGGILPGTGCRFPERVFDPRV